ncbi:MAG: helix-turn-helix transcriptional regulator [Actinobacteria bacterium]|nr:helix-turn-helix transcriptional regulator [Actinomycetota bacterium]
MGTDLIKGHLDPLVLAVVEQGPLHGYAIIEELRRRSGGEFDLPEGTIYPALHRLERLGFLSSRWDESHSRRRRVYELTRGGRRALAVKRDEWTGFRNAVGSVLEGAGG